MGNSRFSSSSVPERNNYKFFTSYREAGEAVQSYELFSTAWDECVELQVQAKENWAQQVLSTLQVQDRWEIGVFADGKVIGGIVVVSEIDPHVGRCMSVIAQYVMPEYRCTGVSVRCMRKAMELARESGYPVLAFTHRIADWKYSTIYRRVR